MPAQCKHAHPTDGRKDIDQGALPGCRPRQILIHNMLDSLLPF